MSEPGPSCSIERRTEITADAPTLIEGLPGLGMVASIAVDQITEQLALKHHANIHSEEFPPLATFVDGRIRDLVRVYAGDDPDVMTLQADIPLPPYSYRALGRCVLDDLADDFDRAIFLVGAPAAEEDVRGQVEGVATSDAVRSDLEDAGIELADGAGLIGGITGALLADCYHGDVPAACLVVRADPYVPDPGAAKALIEDALEPLVDFDIDTSILDEQAAEIQQRKQQVANQLQQMAQGQQPGQPSAAGMYQ